MDEIELGRRQAVGARAQELLNSELLNETFAYLEGEYLQAWRQTRVKDTDARDRLWQAVQILGIVREHLVKLVSDGKIASKDMARIKYLKR